MSSAPFHRITKSTTRTSTKPSGSNPAHRKSRVFGNEMLSLSPPPGPLPGSSSTIAWKAVSCQQNINKPLQDNQTATSTAPEMLHLTGSKEACPKSNPSCCVVSLKPIVLKNDNHFLQTHLVLTNVIVPFIVRGPLPSEV